jgi:hypothetical protein
VSEEIENKVNITAITVLQEMLLNSHPIHFVAETETRMNFKLLK